MAARRTRTVKPRTRDPKPETRDPEKPEKPKQKRNPRPVMYGPPRLESKCCNRPMRQADGSRPDPKAGNMVEYVTCSKCKKPWANVRPMSTAERERYQTRRDAELNTDRLTRDAD